MIDPTATNPHLVVTIPAGVLSLDQRSVEARSQRAFQNQLGRVLEERLGRWVRVLVEPDTDYQVNDHTVHPFDLRILDQINAAIDELLADPERWRVPRVWHYDVTCFDVDHYGGEAHWGAFTIRYEGETLCEPYRMYAGLRFAGELKRTWYRYRLQREWPMETTGFRVVENAVERWLTERWPEGPVSRSDSQG